MMTVKKNGADASSSSTKKKKQQQQQTTSSTMASTSSKTSSTSNSKISKVVESKATKQEIIHSEGLSKSSSSSSLQISDVSHLPLKANLTTYMVTEALPTGSGEKITTFHPETGSTSTEYRHFVAQDTTAHHSTDIQQIGSTLNQSIQNLNESTSNLSQVSGSTYTVTEPMEELKLSYNPNDSAWNGKFVEEKNSLQKGKKSDTLVKQSSTSKHESKSSAKTTSSSYSVEIVDGKERILDQKQHGTARSSHSINDESLEIKSGTNVTPEVHFVQKSTKSSTKMDSSKPELQQPKTKSSQAVREIHQVGDEISTSTNVIQDKAVSSTQAIIDKTKHFTDSVITDNDNKQKKVSKILDNNSSLATKTVTYYDSKGNIVKTVTEAEPSSSSSTIKTCIDKDSSHIKKDSKNIHGRVVDSSTNIDVTKRVIEDDTSIQSTEIDSNYHIQGKSPGHRSPNRKTDLPNHENTSYYVDENFVDTNKIRQAQVRSDSTNFYGHNIDSSKTMVSNVYDTSAIQNTIGYRDRVIMDENMDTTDLVFSNDRNYGKTGWNGQFTYEHPPESKKTGSPNTPAKEKPETKSPYEMPAAGAPSRKDNSVPETRKSHSPSRNASKVSPERQQVAEASSRPERRSPEQMKSKPGTQTQDFLTMETQENIKQFTDENTMEWTKTVDEGSSTVIEGDTTIEYFQIVDGKKIPIGQKVIPGKTLTESYDNISGRRESKTTVHEPKSLTSVDATKPNDRKPKPSSPESLPAAGKPSRKPDERKLTSQKMGVQREMQSDSVTTTEYTGNSKMESHHSLTEEKDSTSIIKQNTQDRVNRTSNTEQQKAIDQRATTTEKRISPDKLPAAGMPSKKTSEQKFSQDLRKKSITTEYTEIEGDTVIEYFEIVDGKQIPTGKKVVPGSVKTEIFDSSTTKEKQNSNKQTIHDSTTETTIVQELESVVNHKDTTDKQKPKGKKIYSPDELPAAGMPSRRPTTDATNPKQQVPVSSAIDTTTGLHRTVDEGSSTIIEGDTTIEYFQIVDGKKIPIGQKVIPGSTTTKFYDNISGRRESKTIVHDTEKLVENTNINEEEYVTVDGKRPAKKTPLNKNKPQRAPEELPAAGMPSRKTENQKVTAISDQKSTELHEKNIRRDSTTNEYTEVMGDTVIEFFDIVDGQRIPKGTKVIPGGTTTKTKSDMREFSGKETIVDSRCVTIDDMNFGDAPIASTNKVDTRDTTNNTLKTSGMIVESTNIIEEYTIVDGQRIPLNPSDKKKPIRVSPDKLPAAGMPSRKDKKSPENEYPKRRESPEKKGKVNPESLPAAGVPSKQTKETIIKDSQKFIDNEATIEYTIINGQKIPLKPTHMEPLKKGKSESPSRNQPDSMTTDIVETVSNISETRKTIVKDSQVSQNYQSSVEKYTIVNGEKIPHGPNDRLPIEEFRQPSRELPEDLPAAGKPSRPNDKKIRLPEEQRDSSTTVETSERVSDLVDSKTTIIRDSKTFIENEIVIEKYGTEDDKKISSYEQLPAAGMPSRRDQKVPDDKTPKKKPSPSNKKNKVSPEDYPAAGKPSQPDNRSVVPHTPTKKHPETDRVDSTTTVESFETVSKVFDSKTTVMKDSQTFVDQQTNVEHYQIVNGQRVPLGAESPQTKPAAGMPSRREHNKPEGKTPKKKPVSPERKSKESPENFPAAGKPSQPYDRSVLPHKSTQKHPESALVDSTATVESFETVSKVFDSKVTVVKDSQKFVDHQSNVENYTIVNGERVPSERKHIPEKPTKKSPEELPAAGRPSRKSLGDNKPRKGPEGPDSITSTTVENYEVVSNFMDVKSNITKDFTTETIVEKFTTDLNDVRDTTIITDTVDRVNKTFIKENILDIKDINEVENITNIKRISDNKVIEIEKVIREPAPETPHYKPPMKEQCICELCICGKETSTSHSHNK